MNVHYAEILAAFKDPPLWFDENAVPRWVAFTPRHCANIYADEVQLQEVACDGCRRRFQVACSRSYTQMRAQHFMLHNNGADFKLSDWAVHPPHFGDPPNIECCPAGPTMNVELIRVVEHWRRGKGVADWERVA